MMVERIVALQERWINQRLRMRQANARTVTKGNIYRFFSVHLLTHLAKTESEGRAYPFAGTGFHTINQGNVRNLYCKHVCLPFITRDARKGNLERNAGRNAVFDGI